MKQSKPQGAVRLLFVTEFIFSSFPLKFFSGFEAKSSFDFKDAPAPKKMNYVGEMILNRQNLPAFAKEMDILHRGLAGVGFVQVVYCNRCHMIGPHFLIELSVHGLENIVNLKPDNNQSGI